MAEESKSEILELTAEIAAAYVRNHIVSAEDLPSIISAIRSALINAGAPEPQAIELSRTPAVPIRKSVADDYIICLEDGRKLKTLKGHLRAKYNMSPEEYRRKWGLPPDYPMVAPAYAAKRSALAKSMGLGRGDRRGARKASPPAETRSESKS
jgi:predicted transcriptional regulator